MGVKHALLGSLVCSNTHAHTLFQTFNIFQNIFMNIGRENTSTDLKGVTFKGNAMAAVVKTVIVCYKTYQCESDLNWKIF